MKAVSHKTSSYLTKRVTIRASRAAVSRASRRAMNLVGYVVKTENDWVVRHNSDGSIQKISRYKTSKRCPLVLD